MKIEEENPIEAKAIFRWLSRNATESVHGATTEELLQEVVDEMKDELEEDLKLSPAADEDMEFKYPRFMKKVKDKAEEYKRNSHGYRKICCVPPFCLGLVMASRVPGHYMRSPWFKLGVLEDMIDVYGSVSEAFCGVGCGGWRTDENSPSFFPSSSSKAWNIWNESRTRRSRRCP